MIMIPCPFCGRRSHEEFAYGGDAGPERPPLDDRSMERWYRYVFVRSNPRGVMREFWQHLGGCRSWLVVERDTATHEVMGAVLATDAMPQGEPDGTG